MLGFRSSNTKVNMKKIHLLQSTTSIGQKEYLPLDFLTTPHEIAGSQDRHKVTANVVLFFSYTQPAPKAGQGLWSHATELCHANVKLIANFLDAVESGQYHGHAIHAADGLPRITASISA